jgi:hypothetical protein
MGMRENRPWSHENETWSCKLELEARAGAVHALEPGECQRKLEVRGPGATRTWSRWSIVPGAWSPWSMEPGAWSLENGRWRMVAGEWSLENGAWSLEHRAAGACKTW